jgi:hypothetical protein
MAITRSQMKRQLYSIGGGAIKGTDAGNGREGFFKPVIGGPKQNHPLAIGTGGMGPIQLGGFGPRQQIQLPMGVLPQGGEQAIYPRIGGLRSGISSAEQELQDILQSIDQVQSTLGESSGQPAGTGVMDAQDRTVFGIPNGPGLKDIYGNPARPGGYPAVPAGGLSQTLGSSPMSTAMRNMAADGGIMNVSPRQLYAGGGIMDVTPRENFGLGSKFKKFVRKIIPNEIADVAVKAAPFVAPFNPLIAAGMAGLGGFDQSGSLSKSLRSGALTYGLGNLARVVGGAGFQGGLKAPGTGTGFGSYFTSPMSGQQLFGGMPESAPVVSDAGFDQSLIGSPGAGDPAQFLTEQALTSFEQAATPKTYSGLLKQLVSPEATLGQRTQAIKKLGGKALRAIYTTDKGELDKNALFSTIAGVGSYIEAKKLAEEAGEDTEGYTEEMYEADKAKYMEKYKELLNPEQFYATGGRVKLETGGIPSIMLAKKEYNFMDLIDKEGEDEYYEKKAEELDRKYNPEKYKQILPKEKPMDKYMLDEIMSEKGMRTLSEETRDDAMKMYAEKAFKKGQISEDEYREIMGFKVGGRVGYKDAGLSSLADYEKQERLAELESLIDKLMTEEGIQDKGYAARLAGDLINMKNKGIDSDRLKFLNEKSALYALPTNMRPEPEYYDALNALEKRTNRKLGSPEKGEEGIVSLDIDMGGDEDNMMMADAPGITFTTSEKSYLFKTLAGQGGSDKSFTMPQLYGILNNPNSDTNIEDAKALKAFLKIKGFKTGGRVQYAMGSEVPVRENQVGVSEMDFRETGGFVPPIGVKEKADDIPAMLSNNEFVFTADAVRAAGGGSVNKGAQKMYTLMKQLEGKVI